MFEEWGRIEWLILVVDVLALYIVYRFLKKRIQHKLDEVEARQRHHLVQRKKNAEDAKDSNKE
ncbi:MAG: hypothetical protein DWC04_00395 [Candidatus Poseidoniales archaeon]|nr:MAG: hypothetical protein DWC04_00395 [Candidatus Poseidoniales archaeon]